MSGSNVHKNEDDNTTILACHLSISNTQQGDLITAILN